MPAPGDGGQGYNWFAVEVVSEHVEPDLEPVIEPGGQGGRPISTGGGGWFEEFEERHSGGVHGSREFRHIVPARVKSPHHRIIARVPGQVGVVQNVEARFSAARGPHEQWAKLLRDDEELLLSL